MTISGNILKCASHDSMVNVLHPDYIHTAHIYAVQNIPLLPLFQIFIHAYCIPFHLLFLKINTNLFAYYSLQYAVYTAQYVVSTVVHLVCSFVC